MDLIAWTVLGIIAGYIASIIMGTDSEQGPIMDIVLGIIGAFVGGLILNLFGQPGVTGFNLYSGVVAVMGAVVLVWAGRMLSNRI